MKWARNLAITFLLGLSAACLLATFVAPAS